MIKLSWFDKNLKIINRILLVLIIILNAYLLITPFLPQVTYQVKTVFSEPKYLETEEQRQVIDRSYNHLVIPKLNFDNKVWQGPEESLVNKGVWHIPYSSTPDKGSNTVLVGHRFSYKDPAVFYHLDKLKIDEQVIVSWEGKLYTYRVYETKIVEPTDVYVEEATEEDILTLYTCHPLWSTAQRLVVTAKLEAIE